MLWSATVAISELEKKGNFWLPEILFEDFVNHTNEKEKVEQAIIDILNQKKPKRLLNIGSGFDTLSKLKEFPESIDKITVVEKNTSYVQSYTDNKIDVVYTDFEFWESEEKYDFILASHVLFYFNDKKSAIEKMLSYLTPNGVAVFITHSPTDDYKKLKDFVFSFHDKKYTFTYDKLTNVLNELGSEYEEVKVQCLVKAKSVDELYKVLRLWFEMDLKSYYELEKEVKVQLNNPIVEYSNSILVVHPPK
jgi:SAM-dependent methyltransferase